MPEKEFKVGDIVMLKSGGPKMTVNEMKSDGRILCKWFAGNNPETEHFNAETLKAVKTAVPTAMKRKRKRPI